MSVARPAARCLLRRSLAAAPATASNPAPSISGSCHQFHSSAQLAARKRSRFRNLRAAEMGLVTPEKIEEFSKKKFPDFTEADKEILRKRYSPEQLEALEAGEAAVDPKDLTIQGRLRNDPYKFPYVEDFMNIVPVVDKRPKTKGPPVSDSEFMLPDDFRDDLMKWIQSFVPKDINLDGLSDEELQKQIEKWGPKDVDTLEYWFERSAMTDNGQGSNTALAPALPEKVPGVAGLYKAEQDPADEGRDPEGMYQDLKKRTNMNLRDILHIQTKILVTRWVSNQTRLGKVKSQYVLAIAGNGNGRLGVGEAKSTEGMVAVNKAKQLAIRNMKPIPRYEKRTIYGNVEAKVGATVVQLYNRPPGLYPLSKGLYGDADYTRIWPPSLP